MLVRYQVGSIEVLSSLDCGALRYGPRAEGLAGPPEPDQGF
ncbi:MAG TPA: hypothetical protein VJN44_07740 [Roseateles sp.]|nr:hypothetical protein [Roseateles sp.]